jgi:hypothetical protein
MLGALRFPLLICALFALCVPTWSVPQSARRGGIAGLMCDGDLWCDPDRGMCKAADIAGKCVSIPDVCAQILSEVCGCDGRTYANDCERRIAKVTKHSDGHCSK